MVSIQKVSLKSFALNKVGKEFAVKLPKNEMYTINVTNMMGKTVKSLRSNGQSQVIVSNNLTNGVYFVTAVSKNNSITKKLDLYRR